uniref:Uncharacterized protein n=1 Tax=Arundo donax TaxID=35708 RepID=A0A0A9HUB3_ARUDO
MRNKKLDADAYNKFIADLQNYRKERNSMKTCE